ncbi:MAG: hypothetical protein KKG47_02250 [Proteobacteria bacterium]|nr:hypothetical protein [Pseudomonadota bacterium]MBU1737400.1 hypothetical protein [Pseudomonadota bacterium]
MTATRTNTITRVETGTAVDGLTLATMITMAVSSGLIGLWAIGCLVAAFVTNGAGSVVMGFVNALTGI